jgi:hypothetical protein|tara:strand:+ start:540 stop:887 length:348 start_codon:yes stop_codon:yes gene_type:complete
MKVAEEKTDNVGGLYYDHSTVYERGKIDPFESFYVQENIERAQIKKLSKAEKVNHPAHYNAGKIEVIDAIVDWELDFIEGNVVKYVTRAKHKGDQLGDLKKARWYLDYLIKNLEK